MAKPDLIQVSASLHKEVSANEAYLYVTVQGSSLVRGGEALRKAKEVRQLAEALAGIGLPADAVQLRGVRATRESGTIRTSSAAIYSLRIHCRDLEKLPDVLGVVTEQKNATLGAIDWIYPFDKDDSLRDEWVDECVARADAKARRIAKALGVRILGVHRLSESAPTSLTFERNLMHRMELSDLRSVETARQDLGLEMTHTKEVLIKVQAEFRVSAFAEGP